jgi:hypothetical protein
MRSPQFEHRVVNQPPKLGAICDCSGTKCSNKCPEDGSPPSPQGATEALDFELPGGALATSGDGPPPHNLLPRAVVSETPSLPPRIVIQAPHVKPPRFPLSAGVMRLKGTVEPPAGVGAPGVLPGSSRPLTAKLRIGSTVVAHGALSLGPRLVAGSPIRTILFDARAVRPEDPCDLKFIQDAIREDRRNGLRLLRKCLDCVISDFLSLIGAITKFFDAIARGEDAPAKFMKLIEELEACFGLASGDQQPAQQLVSVLSALHSLFAWINSRALGLNAREKDSIERKLRGKSGEHREHQVDYWLRRAKEFETEYRNAAGFREYLERLASRGKCCTPESIELWLRNRDKPNRTRRGNGFNVVVENGQIMIGIGYKAIVKTALKSIRERKRSESGIIIKTSVTKKAGWTGMPMALGDPCKSIESDPNPEDFYMISGTNLHEGPSDVTLCDPNSGVERDIATSYPKEDHSDTSRTCPTFCYDDFPGYTATDNRDMQCVSATRIAERTLKGQVLHVSWSFTIRARADPRECGEKKEHYSFILRFSGDENEIRVSVFAKGFLNSEGEKEEFRSSASIPRDEWMEQAAKIDVRQNKGK